LKVEPQRHLLSRILPAVGATSVVFRIVSLALGVWFIVGYLAVARFRIPYPFELEWLEAASLEHVRRVRFGEPLYVPPSVDFIPLIYTPLFYWISAAFSWITGIGLHTLRLVSFLSSLGVLFVIFRLVSKETASFRCALLAASLFAASFKISRSWFDIGKPDSLALLLVLAAGYAIRRSASRGSWTVAGVLLSLAFLARQPTAFIALPLILYAVVARPPAGLRLAAVTGGIIGASIWLLNHHSEGWFAYYVFFLPARHHVLKSALTDFWTRAVLPPFFVALLIALCGRLFPLPDGDRRRDWFYAALAVGTFAASWAGMLNRGGTANSLLPAYAMIAIGFGIGVHRAERFFSAQREDVAALMRAGLWIACCAQFVLLLYDPRREIPTAQCRKAGAALVEKIRAIDGEVFAPGHSDITRLAGKKSFADRVALQEIEGHFGGEPTAAGGAVREEIRRAIERKRFAAVLFLGPEWFQGEIDRAYVLKEIVSAPIRGRGTRNERLYVRRSE
jgi:4-amino-4-deoxy-L-arabinose transferase-like glycosyltransferase